MLARLPDLSAQADAFAHASRSEATKRAYRGAWLRFVAWCDAHALSSLPAAPSTAGLYLTDLAQTRRVATIQLAAVVISQAHKMAGHANPIDDNVRRILAGIRRRLGVAPRRKAALEVAELREATARLPDSIRGVRDRALLLLGFAGAFRRSELVALDLSDLRFEPRGMVVTVRRSKTDQEGAGSTKGIAFAADERTCAVRATQQWIERAGITSGPLFRTIRGGGTVCETRMCDAAVARAVKRAVRALGVDPAEYAGHSLRAGLVTSAHKHGAQEADIAALTGHRSSEMLRRYIRDANPFRVRVL